MALVDRYSGVIFDYGGVLAFHQTVADSAGMANIAGLPARAFHDLYWTDRLAYDRGLTTAEDYWNDLARRGGVALDSQQILRLIEADVQSWLKFDSGVYDFAESLRQSGKQIAVLSNMPRELGEVLKAKTNGFAPFAHLTLSYEVKSVKPEPAIYEHCLAGMGLRPEEILFLDDRIENIRGAERLGVRGVQFTSRDEVLPKLMAET
ncbi:MAG TPA: HAD family phosphatase [Bryobacteraceae bacterium]|jgi:putative hydrolase of the HAD superfamily|nr:HAD family phosphatase [Bryobacteraceae bacterium]